MPFCLSCQFVVKSGSDYSVHLSDPDTIVDWDLVEQVGLKTNDAMPSCPICLYPPRAAKTARCGHVFCWPCILHYLALSDDTSRKCPICYAQVSKTDLKSVVALTRDQGRRILSSHQSDACSTYLYSLRT